MQSNDIPNAGLCERCRHCKQVRTERGSVFYLCGLHDRDPRFAKYPHVPVLHCSGYVRKAPA